MLIPAHVWNLVRSAMHRAWQRYRQGLTAGFSAWNSEIFPSIVSLNGFWNRSTRDWDSLARMFGSHSFLAREFRVFMLQVHCDYSSSLLWISLSENWVPSNQVHLFIIMFPTSYVYKFSFYGFVLYIYSIIFHYVCIYIYIYMCTQPNSIIFHYIPLYSIIFHYIVHIQILSILSTTSFPILAYWLCIWPWRPLGYWLCIAWSEPGHLNILLD